MQWGGLSWNDLSGIRRITSQSTFPYSKWYVWLRSVERWSWALYLPRMFKRIRLYLIRSIYFTRSFERANIFDEVLPVALVPACRNVMDPQKKRIQKPCSEPSKMHFSLMRGTIPDGVQPRKKNFLVQRHTYLHTLAMWWGVRTTFCVHNVWCWVRYWPPNVTGQNKRTVDLLSLHTPSAKFTFSDDHSSQSCFRFADRVWLSFMLLVTCIHTSF